MKKGQWSEEQIIKILQEAEAGADTIQNICRKHGVSEQSFYRWRQRFGGMSVSDAVRLRELERENARLKKLVAERDLEIEVMKEIAAKKWEAPLPDASRCAMRFREGCRAARRVG